MLKLNLSFVHCFRFKIYSNPISIKSKTDEIQKINMPNYSTYMGNICFDFVSNRPTGFERFNKRYGCK